MTVWTAIVTSQVFAITLRILLSIGLGALIGLERQLRARSAGIRTNALVSLGSCLFTTVGVYTLAAGTGDPTRVAAQVASGIGFLGAGVSSSKGGVRRSGPFQHRGHAMGVGGGRHVVRLRHGSGRRNRGHRHHARQHDAPADRRGHRRPAHRAIA